MRTDQRTPTPISPALIAQGTLIILVLWALANAVWLGRNVLFIAFFAILVASFLSIFVDWLEQRNVPRAAGGPLVLLVLLGLLGGMLTLAWPTLASQLADLRERLPEMIGAFSDWVSDRLSVVSTSLGMAGEDVEESVRDGVPTDMTSLLGGALPLLNTAVGAVSGVLLVLVAGLFMAIQPRVYSRGLHLLLPRSRRARMHEVLLEMGDTLRRWMAAQALGMLVIGILTTVGLWLIGVPAALALGLIAGLLEFVPYVGPALSFIPAIAMAFTVSPTAVWWTVGLYALIQFIESNLLMPLLVKGAVDLPPALTLLFQTLMATLFGFLGLLLAVPMLAAGRVLINDLYVDEVADEH